MSNEVFRCVELPVDVFSSVDSLALLFDNCPRGRRSSDERSIDMWVMNGNNDGGEKNTQIID